VTNKTSGIFITRIIIIHHISDLSFHYVMYVIKMYNYFVRRFFMPFAMTFEVFRRHLGNLTDGH